MENTNIFSAEELQNCPYHQMINMQANNDKDQNKNTGDWGDFDDDDPNDTSPDGQQNRENDNSGGAGSTGSAATND